jgi:hypothetical protein
LFRVAKQSGPTPQAAAKLEAEILASLGPPSLKQRTMSLLAPVAAAWTAFTLRHDAFQHPKLVRRAYRMSPWALRAGQLGPLRVTLELALHRTLVKLEGSMDSSSASGLAAGILSHLQRNDAQVQVVVAEGTQATREHLRLLAKKLAPLRHRISISIPTAPETWAYFKQLLEVPPALG